VILNLSKLGYISETVQDIGDKVLLITNRKSHELSIGTKSGDIEQRSGRYFRYFSEIGCIRGASSF